MAIPDERLVLSAEVQNNFEDTLDDLEQQLARVDRVAAETVEDIVADVAIGDAMADLAALKGGMLSVDDTINIQAEVDTPTASSVASSMPDGGDILRQMSDRVGGEIGGDDALNPFGIGMTDVEMARATRKGIPPTSVFDTDPLPNPFVFEDNRPSVFTSLADLPDSSLPDPSVDPLDPFGLNEPDDSPTLIERFRDLELKMGDFFKVLAALVPLVGVFVGALPAAIAGVAALGGAALAAAGALGAVGGLALLGMSLGSNGEVGVAAIERRITELFNTFVDSFAPVARELAPLAEDAFVAANRIVRAVGVRARELTALSDEFRSAIGFLESTVPSVFTDIVRLGTAAAPLIGGIISDLADLDLFEILANVLARVGPLLLSITASIGRMLSPIFELSQGFLFVAFAVTSLLSALFQVIDVIPFLGEGLGMIVGILLTATTATALYSAVTNSATIALLKFAGGMLTKLVPSVLASTKALLGYIGVQRTAIASTILLTTVTASLLGLLTFGLAPALGLASGLFSGLSSDIDDATSSLRSFGQMSDRVSGIGGGFGGVAGPSASGSGGYRNVTVVAPDKETGTSVANTLSFTTRQTGDRLHQGGS